MTLNKFFDFPVITELEVAINVVSVYTTAVLRLQK